MKKEILFKEGKISLSFFYAEKMISTKEKKEIQNWCTYLTRGLDSFLKQKELKTILATSQVKNIYFNLNLVGDYRIKKLNFQYREKNRITDVLSFPMQDNVRGGELDVFHGELELGDIFICKNVCEKQAREFKLSFFEEFIHLGVHGFLHLLGYDHEISQEQEKLMEKLEEKIVKKVFLLASKN